MIEQFAVAFVLVESWTDSVTGKLPLAVGVPVRAPVAGFRLRPGASVPASTAKLE